MQHALELVVLVAGPPRLAPFAAPVPRKPIFDAGQAEIRWAILLLQRHDGGVRQHVPHLIADTL